ncbi:MAG: DUF2520 domain-containing protein [Ignavibacteriales bacterium]|nr:DUF2520 domain-containing protein [Ignavibacteriales bacterium]
MKNNSYSYLIVGNGKFSKHFQYLFAIKSISFKLWFRGSKESFESLCNEAEKILVLIKDDEIINFIEANRQFVDQPIIWIHCSGMISTPLAESAHPLMTFTDKLYEPQIYNSIPFITEKNRLSFKELFPDLNNPNFQIESQDKILYHAFSVMSGNFTTILWQCFFDFLTSRNIPQAIAYTYLDRIIHNLKDDNSPLTGPIQRKDVNTIYKHLEALENNPFRNVYISFLEAYDQIKTGAEIENN